MKRMKVPRRLDRKIFRRSASRTKALNTGKVHMRGGIRL